MAAYNQTVRYKMILFGSESVGKTSLVERFINDKFEEEYISTLGYNVYEKQIPHNQTLISLMVFDIGGQERFRQLRRKYAEGANVAFIIYDISNRESFEQVPEWRKDLIEFAGDIPFMLIGNKLDLAHRQVSSDELKTLSSEIGAVDYLETSAKTGHGVDEAFNKLAFAAYKAKAKL